MGLDITAWSKVEKVQGCPTCGHVDDEDGVHATVSDHPDCWPERAAPFVSGDVLRRSGDRGHIRFGYSGWSYFRSLICEAANGEPADRDHPKFWEREERGDAVLWDLINFTDCDGYLGPVACERIHRELVETRPKFVERAAKEPEHQSTHLVPRYDELTAVFAVAKDGGLVRFG